MSRVTCIGLTQSKILYTAYYLMICSDKINWSIWYLIYAQTLFTSGLRILRTCTSLNSHLKQFLLHLVYLLTARSHS